jgi:hypothetical protein
VLDGDAVQQNGLRWHIDRVGHQRRLYHNKGIVNIFFIEDVSV